MFSILLWCENKKRTERFKQTFITIIKTISDEKAMAYNNNVDEV